MCALTVATDAPHERVGDATERVELVHVEHVEVIRTVGDHLQLVEVDRRTCVETEKGQRAWML